MSEERLFFMTPAEKPKDFVSRKLPMRNPMWGMFMPFEIAMCTSISPREKIVLCLICHMDQDGVGCRLTNAEISGYLGFTEDVVRRSVALLAKKKIIDNYGSGWKYRSLRLKQNAPIVPEDF